MQDSGICRWQYDALQDLHNNMSLTNHGGSESFQVLEEGSENYINLEAYFYIPCFYRN
jgi:hypothetical protein